MIEGIKVNLGGREFVAPPIPLKIFRTKAAWFEAVSYTHLTLPTTLHECRSRWSPYH